MKNKLLGTICLVLGIIIVVTTGTTYAYYITTTSSNKISGEGYKFNVSLTANTVYSATKLVPLNDSLVSSAISKSSNKCRDSRGYEVCSLYSLTLSNTGESETLNGFVSTTSTTYTTDNLKYQIFDSSYNAITDATVISRVVDEKKYFKKSNAMVNTQINSTNVTYYIAIWLHDTGALQNSDYSKTFSGKVGFESIHGEELKANISA